MTSLWRYLSIFVGFLALLTSAYPYSLAQSNDFDVKTLGLLWESEPLHNATLWSVAWSPNGSYISATFFDNTTVVVNSTTGSPLIKIGPHRDEWLSEGTRCDAIKECEVENHLPARASAWSPDGSYLAVGGDDTQIAVYDTTTWELVKILSGHEGSVLSLSWSPDGRFIASGSGTDKVEMHNIDTPENMVKIWDFEKGTVVQNLTGHLDGILQIRWSSDQSRLVSASDDKTIKMWNTRTWKNVLNFTGHTIGVLSVDWGPEETMLVSGSRDYKVNIWNASTGEMLARWQAPNCVRSVDWHPYANIIATSGVRESYIMIRNATTGSTLKTFKDNEKAGGVIQSAVWSPDGRRLAAGSNVESMIRVYAFGAGEHEAAPLPDWLPGLVLFFLLFSLIIVAVAVKIPKRMRSYKRR
ncbi:MAG: WD40 repeat domain-containing protein [Thermoplasmata archaeon]